MFRNGNSVPLLAALLVLGISMSVADRYRDEVRITKTGERYCVTRGNQPVTLRPGQTINTDDCYRCRCSYYGLVCDGFGVKHANNANRIDPPEGCQLLIRGCDYYFISINNPSYIC